MRRKFQPGVEFAFGAAVSKLLAPRQAYGSCCWKQLQFQLRVPATTMHRISSIKVETLVELIDLRLADQRSLASARRLSSIVRLV